MCDSTLIYEREFGPAFGKEGQLRGTAPGASDICCRSQAIRRAEMTESSLRKRRIGGRFVTENHLQYFRPRIPLQLTVHKKTDHLAIGCPPSPRYPRPIAQDQGVGVGGHPE